MARLFKKAISDGPILAAALICLTALITHGTGIPRLGYYHDDWYMLWSAASRGVESLAPLFSMDRPFMGRLYIVFYRIIGENIAGWHLFTLVFRTAGALAFYWILRIVWPRLRGLAVLGGMLFVVFPGFLAEPNAATKINHLAGYGAALFSIALTLHAACETRKEWRYAAAALALLLMAFYLWIYEYMIGLEVMRLSLLFWVWWQGRRGEAVATAKRTARAYIPYAAVIVVFLFWRVFLFDSTRYATDMGSLAKSYLFDFQNMALRLVFQTIKDFFSTTVFAWAVQAYQLFTRATYLEMVIALLFAAVVTALAVWYTRAARPAFADGGAEDESDAGAPPYALAALGALIALAAVFPVVLSNRFINLLDQYKAYALHPSAGVIILVLGAALMLRPRFRTPALIALLALSVMTQSLNIQRWATFWDIQRNFWWQLTWRAPDLKDWTLVMAYLPDGYPLQQDYEIWGPINLIYRQRPEPSPLITSEVLNTDTMVEVFNGTYTEPHVRDIYLPRVYSNFLLMSQPTTRSCVHVIDGQMPAYSASERLIVEKVGGYSIIDHIIPEGQAPAPPPEIFGPEPERGWCYYYQRASLARQTGDWAQVSALYDETQALGLSAGDASELFVFIEGLVNTGREEEAQALAAGAVKNNPRLKFSLCSSVSGAPDYPESFGYRKEAVKALFCDPPGD